MEQRAVTPFRVFLVEDSPILKTRVETMLASIPGASLAGHAADAEGAIRDILASRPDAVILDVHLAQGTGFDVLRGLRAAKVMPAVYVLTNFATEAYRATARKLGAQGFFDKSTEFELLRAVLAAARPATP
jgi:two-component system, NarL family, response regulator DevR